MNLSATIKQGTNLSKKVMNLSYVKFPVTVMTRFGNDNGGLFAAGLAFFMVLSLAPLILTAVAVMAFFIHDPAQASEKVVGLVQGLFPKGAQKELTGYFVGRLGINGAIGKLIHGRLLAGIIGILTLLWASMQIFINASTAMNAAFEVKEKRSWVLLRAIALGMLFISGILMSLSLFLSTAPNAIARFGHSINLPLPLWLLSVIFEIIAVLVNAALYTNIYKFLPSADVSWKSAFIGGLTASVFWEIAKKLLASYLLKSNSSLYGGVGDLILFILWIYYSMMILLIGAEVAALVQGAPMAVRGKPHFGQPSGDQEDHPHASKRPTRDEKIRRSSKGVGAELG